ncbi:hypothetical protein [Saccharibacillus alkalitolerans]|uniref:hypothetical protein n=1 Tax=Saccharibacillus alkalitolerans TaxID=2705290 RepID=UPI00197CDBDF|nr:hypothetical protein [Saccharibacillus alkalitolerans]
MRKDQQGVEGRPKEMEPEHESSEPEQAEGEKRGRREGAQTFRRGRALHFLERLELRRSTLAAQLEESAFESIRPVIAGELKAVDAIMQEFVQVFELHEKPEKRGRGESGHRGHGRGRRHQERREEESGTREERKAPEESRMPENGEDKS